MAKIDFYEKPGCINNTKQRKMLEMYGHEVEVISLLTHSWTETSLRAFFGNMPVVEWFNPAAPRIKKGEVIPHAMSEQSALEAMIHDPLLIRRPLIEVGEIKIAGFDNELVSTLLQHHDVSGVLHCPSLSNSCD
jgi:nitrogenase-associated protein